MIMITVIKACKSPLHNAEDFFPYRDSEKPHQNFSPVLFS